MLLLERHAYEGGRSMGRRPTLMTMPLGKVSWALSFGDFLVFPPSSIIISIHFIMALSLLFLAAIASTASAFSINDGHAISSPSSVASAVASSSRREYISRTASSLIAGSVVLTSSSVLLPPSAYAEVSDETPKITTRMGGLLENYQDTRGWTILAPSGWNKFDGEVGAYDVKWEDLVDPTDNVKVSSTPVKSTTTSM